MLPALHPAHAHHPPTPTAIPPARHAPGRSLLLLPLLALLALLLCGFGPPVLLDSDHQPTLRVAPAAADLSGFDAAVDAVGAPAALVYDLTADRFLFARDADAARAPASLAKLMTALLALESGALEQPVTVQGIDLIGNASMGLKVGETLTLEELLWGLLVPSGNDAAMALARAVAGDADTFVAQMNARAAALGLTATRFASPHGLDRDGQTASARDLLRLALLDWKYPLFRTIVGTATATVAGHPLHNTNELLGPLDGGPVQVVGVKTGTTDWAGQCLIAAFDDGGRITFVVVMGSADRYGDVRRLYAAVQARYVWFTPRAADFAALNRMPQPDGSTAWLAAAGTPPALLLPRWLAPLVAPVRILEPGARWERGAVVGRIEWRLGTRVLGTQQLVIR